MATEISGKRRFGALRSWLDERLGLDALRYPVPAHANGIMYTLGGITLFGFILLGITGLYLAQYYHPEPGEARESVIFIVTQVQFGNFVRSLHFWLANLVLVTMALHVARVFMTGAYKRPREINWLVGVGLFAITTALFFTGTVLKWDQEAYEALKHNEAAAKLLGSLGTVATTDFTNSVPLLTRVYLVHASTLAVVLVLLLVVHLALVKRHGISPLTVRGGPSDDNAKNKDTNFGGEGVSYFNLHMRELVGYGLLLGAIAILLSVVFPAALGDAVTPGEEVTKPLWLFWWLYAFENFWGIGALLWVAIAVPVVLAILPFVDRSERRHILDRKLIASAAVIAAIGWAALTIYIWASPTAEHLNMGGS